MKRIRYLIAITGCVALLTLSACGGGESSISMEVVRQQRTIPAPEAATAIGASSTKTGYTTLTATNASGMKMTYYLHVPAYYNPQEKYPLILLLHGGGEVANPKATSAQNRTLLLSQYYTKVWISSEVQDRWPCFVVIPQVTSPHRWVDVAASAGSYTMAAQPNASLSLMKEIVDKLQNEYTGVDANRLYITGLSMGGYGTWEAIERWPSYFAAAVPISGAGDPSKVTSLVHLPIWAFHGTKDNVVPVGGSRDMIRAIIQAGGNPRYTEYPNEGHDLWLPGKTYTPTADPALFNWLFAQHKFS